MLSERAKKEVKLLLNELNINCLDETNTSNFLFEIKLKVYSLVIEDEVEHLEIDRELLKIYRLLIEIIENNENNYEYLNSLFLK